MDLLKNSNKQYKTVDNSDMLLYTVYITDELICMKIMMLAFHISKGLRFLMSGIRRLTKNGGFV